MGAMIQAQNLTLGYGRTPVLQGVNLTVEPGQFWCWLGENGAGKSTLVKAIIGQLKPISGRLTRDPALASPSCMGFVPQRCEFSESLPVSVREFIDLGLAGLGLARAQRGERVRQALAEVALDGLERRDFWSLSGGQRQRVLVARALARKPRLLIADEPAANLDPEAACSLLDLLKARQLASLTVILVTHDPVGARRVATHLARFERGSVNVEAAPC
ncbi:MAG: ABC transporter ATP-binding protein [Planctomycetota bacterium]|nr:MAG: ABC transporter ATP-binding protein [Planctomycetota bacterium]